MNMKKIQFFLVASVILLQVCSLIKGQSNNGEYKVDSSIDAHCELNNLYIDMLAIQAKKDKERIFIISRLSQKEKYGWNRSRLSYAHSILTQIKQIKPEHVVTAIADRTSDKKGRIEFYVGSKLFLVSLAEKNKQICLLCCDTP